MLYTVRCSILIEAGFLSPGAWRGLTPPRTMPCASVPAEVDLAGAVGSLLDQRLVELTAGARVDVSPAELAVVLQAGDVGAEERSKLPSAASALTLITQLVIQHVRLHLHLQDRRRISFTLTLYYILAFFQKRFFCYNMYKNEGKRGYLTDDLIQGDLQSLGHTNSY